MLDLAVALPVELEVADIDPRIDHARDPKPRATVKLPADQRRDHRRRLPRLEMVDQRLSIALSSKSSPFNADSGSITTFAGSNSFTALYSSA